MSAPLATGSDDFSVVSGTFTFLPSDNERFLPITVNDDDVAEDDEQFSLVVMISGQRHVLNFIIRDNDGTYIIIWQIRGSSLPSLPQM